MKKSPISTLAPAGLAALLAIPAQSNASIPSQFVPKTEREQRCLRVASDASRTPAADLDGDGEVSDDESGAFGVLENMRCLIADLRTEIDRERAELTACLIGLTPEERNAVQRAVEESRTAPDKDIELCDPKFQEEASGRLRKKGASPAFAKDLLDKQCDEKRLAAEEKKIRDRLGVCMANEPSTKANIGTYAQRLTEPGNVGEQSNEALRFGSQAEEQIYIWSGKALDNLYENDPDTEDLQASQIRSALHWFDAIKTMSPHLELVRSLLTDARKALRAGNKGTAIECIENARELMRETPEVGK